MQASPRLTCSGRAANVMGQVEQKLLVPQIEVEAPWTETGKIAHQFGRHKISGKGVMRVG
jgi:hypothetical protein